jgi:hypothetical protein
MQTLKAEVRAGRLVLDVPTSIPDGTVVELVVAEADDDLDDDERAALHAALDQGWASARAGKTRPVEALIAELRPRSR